MKSTFDLPNKVKINAYYKKMKVLFDLACISTCCWGLPKPKYEPFITNNRGNLTILKTSLLKIACKPFFMLNYHQILNVIILSTCFLSIRTDFVFLFRTDWLWASLIRAHFLSKNKNIFFEDNLGNVHSKTEVHDLRSLRHNCYLWPGTPQV